MNDTELTMPLEFQYYSGSKREKQVSRGTTALLSKAPAASASQNEGQGVRKFVEKWRNEAELHLIATPNWKNEANFAFTNGLTVRAGDDPRDENLTFWQNEATADFNRQPVARSIRGLQ